MKPCLEWLEQQSEWSLVGFTGELVAFNAPLPGQLAEAKLGRGGVSSRDQGRVRSSTGPDRSC
jgi:hypothetical protein